MPTLCCIVSCSNKQRKGLNLSFFRIPAYIKNEGPRAQELSERRRRLWFAAINREDASWKKVDGWRVCSTHFICGKPASLFDENNPDWVPTKNLGYERFGATSETDLVQSRYDRAKRRKGENANELHDTLRELDDVLQADEISSREGCEKIDPVSASDDVINENESLGPSKSSQESDLQKRRLSANIFSDESDLEDQTKVTFYTGLPSKDIMLPIFNLIAPGISQRQNSALSKFDKFVITLSRLRLNLQIRDLAYRYNVSTYVVSKAFTEIIDLLHINLKGTILWPLREDLMKSMPIVFRDNFGLKVVSIIDCFEVFIERPSNLYARAQTWSNYKHNNTVKYLIGITPQGSISFISDGWGGRASDKYVTINSNFLNNLLPGDVVLADRGFDIDEVLCMKGAKLHIPAFTRGKKQLSGEEVQESRNIANVRIHVERVIGLLRQKYTMLQSTIPINLLITKTGQENPVLDKIVTVACALTNLCQSVVPFD